MTIETLPDPLVPAEVDLRGLEYMPLLGGKLFESDFNLDANDAEFRVGLRLWWAAWNQVPAASLPAEDHRLRGLAGLAENPSKWKKVRDRALHGFVLCSDGRLYHPIVSQQALIAWEKRTEVMDERENTAERQRRSRAERKRLFEQLRSVGITPKYDIAMEDLRRLVAENVTQPVTVTGNAAVTQPVTVTDTGRKGRDGTGRDETFLPQGGERAPPPPSPAGEVCRALKAAGLPSVNPSHPVLLALLDAGATEAEFIDALPSARGKRDGFAYLLSVVKGRREDAAGTAAALHTGAMPKPVARPDRIAAHNAEVVRRFAARSTE